MMHCQMIVYLVDNRQVHIAGYLSGETKRYINQECLIDHERHTVDLLIFKLDLEVIGLQRHLKLRYFFTEMNMLYDSTTSRV